MNYRATRYIVVGHHDCERQTYDADRVQSRHHTQGAAWRAAHTAHRSLGGCEGSNMLARVMRRLDGEERREYRSRRREADADGETVLGGQWDYVEEWEGTLYIEDDYFAAHTVYVDQGRAGTGSRATGGRTGR